MPDNMSLERRALLKAYGAELHLTPAAQVMKGAVERADEICRSNPNSFMPQQFQNPANVDAHRRTTGPEILAQLGNRVPDAFVHGVGTGGTITGVGQVLRAKRPDVPHRRGRAGEQRRAVGRAGRASTASTASAPASCRRSSIARC